VKDDLADDLYDISRLVKPVTAQSSLLPWPLDGYTNGKSFYFSDAQVQAVAAVLPAGQVAPRPGGWQEVVPGKGVRVLAERHINGEIYFRFRKHWDFTAVPS
jgi:hypothetical protein